VRGEVTVHEAWRKVKSQLMIMSAGGWRGEVRQRVLCTTLTDLICVMCEGNTNMEEGVRGARFAKVRGDEVSVQVQGVRALQPTSYII